MEYSLQGRHRKNIRLKEYDYSKEGMYFITICTQNRECILSKIPNVEKKSITRNIIDDFANVGAGLVPAQLEKTHFGKIVENIYLQMECIYKNIKLHNYIIMPNHIHGIIEICNVPFWAGTRPAPTIADVIRDFKSLTTIEYIKGVKKGIYKPFNKRVWQRNYYEHVIRCEKELYEIIEYIEYNPYNWINDSNYKK